MTKNSFSSQYPFPLHFASFPCTFFPHSLFTAYHPDAVLNIALLLSSTVLPIATPFSLEVTLTNINKDTSLSRYGVL